MSSIKEYLTSDHRECDEVFSRFEESIDSGSDEKIKELYEELKDRFLTHFKMEEEVVFKEFLESAGEGCNPIPVMISEHDNMRSLIDRIGQSVEKNDKNMIFSLLDTLMIVVQQHNMKEENVMYNLLDQSIANKDEAISAMKSI
ncbi:MAG: hemerythrin domain-containing protein [Campylobacterales bacterium]